MMSRWTVALRRNEKMTVAEGQAAPRADEEKAVNAKMIVFDKLPLSDTCWSLLTGPDDRIYAAACTEHTGGVSAYLVRYTPAEQLGEGKLEYLFDVGDAVGEPADNGRATQCKIHYCLLADPDSGILYGATHLSGGPRGEIGYSWFGSWHELHRSYRGSFIFAFDTRSDRILWTDMCYPWEGSRCMALDYKRGLIHGVAFPRSHYFVYDLQKRRHTDYGRTGSVNPQAIWLDSEFNAYTTDDHGYVLRFNHDRGRLERLNIRLPFAEHSDGWHNVIYDAVEDPNDPDVIYGVPWNIPARLFRYRMDPSGGAGEMTDLGPAIPGQPYKETGTFFCDHVGGLVFGNDGFLYYCAGDMLREVWHITTDRRCLLMRMDVASGEKEKVGLLNIGEFKAAYVARSARTSKGRIVMGDVMNHPTRLYEYQPETDPNHPAVIPPLRRWG